MTRNSEKACARVRASGLGDFWPRTRAPETARRRARGVPKTPRKQTAQKALPGTDFWSPGSAFGLPPGCPFRLFGRPEAPEAPSGGRRPLNSGLKGLPLLWVSSPASAPFFFLSQLSRFLIFGLPLLRSPSPAGALFFALLLAAFLAHGRS